MSTQHLNTNAKDTTHKPENASPLRIRCCCVCMSGGTKTVHASTRYTLPPVSASNAVSICRHGAACVT